MPNCIFHLPLQINPNRASASQIRPRKMLQAFQNIGYDVAVVMGRAQQRKQQGDEIKRRILNGEQFDFIYSESSTMPTLLTEPNHLPVSRSIDFGFFEFCKARGIRIGLFYRDVYWKFPRYKQTVGSLKSAFAIHYFKRDLAEYSRLLDILYMPTELAFDIVKNETASIAHAPLPPGCDKNEQAMNERLDIVGRYASEKDKPLRLLYVGHIGGDYGFDTLIDALGRVQGTEVTFCVRKDDFEAYERADELTKMPNVTIANASGSGLEPLYHGADIALMCFDENPYLKAAMPFKTFEYIAHGLPIITCGALSVANFILENNVGWVVDGRPEELARLINRLSHQKEEVQEKSSCSIEAARKNTWDDRARAVALQLSVGKG